MQEAYPRISTGLELLHAKRGSGQRGERVEGGILNKRGVDTRPGEDVSGCLSARSGGWDYCRLLRELFFQELAFLKIRGIYSS